MGTFSFCECRLGITSDVGGETRVLIPGAEEPDVRQNKAIELHEHHKRILTVGRRRFMPEHRLDRIVQAAIGVRTMDVEDPLHTIEGERHQRVVSGTQGREIAPAAIGDCLDNKPGDGVITVDADKAVQDSVALHCTGSYRIPVRGRHHLCASAHLRFHQVNRHVRRFVSERGLDLAVSTARSVARSAMSLKTSSQSGSLCSKKPNGESACFGC